MDDPWLLVAGAIVPLAAASFLARLTDRGVPWSFRWDVPPFVVAHAMVVFALGRAARIEELAPAFIGSSTLSFAVAASLRRWPWALAGAVLVAVGAWDLGPGWFAAALGVESVGAGIAASRSEGDRRLLLQVVCGGLAAAAWIETATAIGWSREETLRATALVAGGQLLLAASVVRLRLLAPDWALRAMALAAVGIGTVGYATLEVRLLAADAAANGALARPRDGGDRGGHLGGPVSSSPAGVSGVSSRPRSVRLLRGCSGRTGGGDPGRLGVGSMVVALALWRTGVWRL
jgi:hypothetical protein